jgi:hypothetical protein
MNGDKDAGLKTESAADAELADVLNAYLTEVEAGRPVDTERLLAEHPAIADRLRTCLAALHAAEHGRERGGWSSGRADRCTAHGAPGQGSGG